MLQSLKSFFLSHLDPVIETPESKEHEFRLAVAALLVETMRTDFDTSAEERATFLMLVKSTFGLTDMEAKELLHLSEIAADDATSLYEFTRYINYHLPPERKREVIFLLWQIAYADGQLDKYEDHLIRKVAELIHLPHQEFIQTKLQAKAAKERVD